MYVHALFALRDAELGIIEANFASLAASFLSCIEEHHAMLAADVRDGTISVPARTDTDTALLQQLAAGLAPLPHRAAHIEDVFKQKRSDGGELARALWPHLNLFLTVNTGAFACYASRLGRAVPTYSPVYAATEGLLGVNLQPLRCPARYTLLPRVMFYEFLPVQQDAADKLITGKDSVNGASRGAPLLASEVLIGEQYELVVTNLAGLFRYRLGDVVTVVDRFKQAPVVEFNYRAGQLLNLRGEKLPEDLVLRAVQGVFGPALAGPPPPLRSASGIALAVGFVFLRSNASVRE